MDTLLIPQPSTSETPRSSRGLENTSNGWLHRTANCWSYRSGMSIQAMTGQPIKIYHQYYSQVILSTIQNKKGSHIIAFPKNLIPMYTSEVFRLSWKLTKRPSQLLTIEQTSPASSVPTLFQEACSRLFLLLAD